MPLQWSTPTSPSFTHATPVLVTAAKSLGSGSSVTMHCQVGLDVDGPSPSEATVLDWYGVLYDALEADGWTLELRFEQTSTVHRQITETGE